MLFGRKKTPRVLDRANIVTGCPSEGHEDCIRRCGRMLLEAGYVEEGYIEGMLARDRSLSTAIGNAIAIPHGEMEYKRHILHTGLVVLTYPGGIDWGGETVKLVIGIAAKGDEHIGIMERIGEAFEEQSAVEEVVADADAGRLFGILSPDGEGG
ncbi:MAG: PTS sugar transporter subunit IIA [Deltaproteobacteria bacterium]|nr:PTS sugar transporter subunit IIA [Deltaproteobacteria bacterium]